MSETARLCHFGPSLPHAIHGDTDHRNPLRTAYITPALRCGKETSCVFLQSGKQQEMRQSPAASPCQKTFLNRTQQREMSHSGAYAAIIQAECNPERRILHGTAEPSMPRNWETAGKTEPLT